jgi:hypothetical protein
MLLMVQRESTVMTEEEHGPGPKLPDPWHVKTQTLPVQPAVSRGRYTYKPIATKAEDRGFASRLPIPKG